MQDPVPSPGIEPRPPALRGQSLSLLDHQGSPYLYLIILIFYLAVTEMVCCRI